MKVDGLKCHDTLLPKIKQKLGYGSIDNYKEWKEAIREKFFELTGIKGVEENAAPNRNFEIEKEVQKDGYKQIRFTFESEIDAIVSCYILIPDGLKKGEKRPLVITLQGHSTGFHNSIAEPKTEEEAKNQPRVGFAVQSVNEGYITLAVENRAMGERSAENSPGRRVQVFENMNRCYYETITAQLLGRTMCAERMFDNKCAIDVVLEHFGDIIDENKIAMTGNSGGGTASYYAACYDERIKISMPSCGFCPYPESILRFYHCSCNYIPNAYPWFDMQDLSCLIAPRRLSIVAGEKDPSFLIEGVQRGYETVKKVYQDEGAPNNCNFIQTDKGHWWCVDIIWPEMKRLMAELDK